MKPTLQSWYNGKSILVTGGTGFMGKVLLEKVLRCLPGVKNIYVLMRPKYNMSMSERIEAMAQLPLFEKLLAEKSNALKKIIPVKAEMSSEGLGISADDRAILVENISIVFHFAARLSLIAQLKDAVTENTLGTMRILEICKEFRKLEVFVHLSTAFCHCDVICLEEKVYTPHVDPYEVIRLVQTKCDKEIKEAEKILMGSHPNAYVFSKRLAETIANDVGKKLPVVIARPSIVIPSLHDPIPGWVDSIEGPVGIFVAAGKGVLRTMLCNGDAHAEIIPVDIAINSVISIAWNRANETYEKTPVYNLTTGDLLKITWNEVLEKLRKVIYEYPFEWTLWYPDGNIRKNRLVHNLIIIFCHYLPAYFIDFLLLIFRRRRFMVRVQNRITLGLKVLECFTLRTWYFRNDNALLLEKDFTEDDVVKFPITSSKFDIDEYILASHYGCKYYCLKENSKSLWFWRIYIKFLYCLDKICTLLFFYFVISWILQLLGMSRILNLQFWIDKLTHTSS